MSWPTVADDLLAGPRGRRACFEVVTPYRDSGMLPTCPGWHDVLFGDGVPNAAQLADELADLVADADLSAVAATDAPSGLVAYLAESANWAMYWQPPDETDLALADDQVATTLTPVARAITAAPASQWWSSGIAADMQQYVQFYVDDPDLNMPEPALTDASARLAAWLAKTQEDEREAATRPSDPAANYSGYWWSAPAVSGLVKTTRSLPALGALHLAVVEDSMGWTEASCWPLQPRPDSRIYEISAPADWTDLVARYPLDVSNSRRHDWWRVSGRAGRWLIPDYTAVAADFDGVHVTVGGYLTTAGRALPVPGRDDDACTMLAGWDADVTYWLSDALESAGPAVNWANPNSEPLGWKSAAAG